MEKAYKIYIDSKRIKDSEQSLIIEGWAINRKKHTNLQIDISEDSNVVSKKIEMIQRMDVNTAYEIPLEIQCGFIITLQLKKCTGYVTILFQDDEEIIQRRYKVTSQNGLSYLKKIKKYLKKGKKGRYYEDLRNRQYKKWISQNETTISNDWSSLEYQPLISVIVPVYNAESKWLEKCIQSVQNQRYTNWELCLADDGSTLESVRPLLRRYEAADCRIKVVFRKENGHICAASNSALAIASGEYIALLDNDDELAPDALLEAVKVFNKNPETDLIYSDEDKIDQNGKRTAPFFKTDWEPDTLMGTNYICHLGIYRKSIVEEIGGFRQGYEGSQDYDLVLRFTEKTDRIVHIPKILYHWRMLASSTASGHGAKSYAAEAGRRALEDALKRRGINGEVFHGPAPGLYLTNYALMNTEEWVSIIIPTRDGYDVLKECLASIYEKTSYPHFEVIIADNGSKDPRVLSLLKSYEQKGSNFHVLKLDMPFNYSKINNIAVKRTKGKYLLFLNNDTKVISSEWLQKMVAYAQMDHIGAVGARLLFANQTIQHSGVILGVAGIAGHGHSQWLNGEYGYFSRLAIDCNYSAVTAACLMVKKLDFMIVGGFDEDLKIAYNDIDFCLKLMSKGKNNICLTGVELFHYESASRGSDFTIDKRERFAEESEIMKKRWRTYIDNDPHYSPNLSRKDFDYTLRI